MQRLIKFRVWDSAQNKYINPTINYTDGRWFFFGNVYLLEEKGLILQQFTGLLDKNGKEIYEGDIIKGESGIGSVYFKDGCFMVDQDIWLYDYNSEDEIIGNIFETPELLK